MSLELAPGAEIADGSPGVTEMLRCATEPMVVAAAPSTKDVDVIVGRGASVEPSGLTVSKTMLLTVLRVGVSVTYTIEEAAGLVVVAGELPPRMPIRSEATPASLEVVLIKDVEDAELVEVVESVVEIEVELVAVFGSLLSLLMIAIVSVTVIRP